MCICVCAMCGCLPVCVSVIKLACKTGFLCFLHVFVSYAFCWHTHVGLYVCLCVCFPCDNCVLLVS